MSNEPSQKSVSEQWLEQVNDVVEKLTKQEQRLTDLSLALRRTHAEGLSDELSGCAAMLRHAALDLRRATYDKLKSEVGGSADTLSFAAMLALASRKGSEENDKADAN